MEIIFTRGNRYGNHARNNNRHSLLGDTRFSLPPVLSSYHRLFALRCAANAFTESFHSPVLAFSPRERKIIIAGDVIIRAVTIIFCGVMAIDRVT